MLIYRAIIRSAIDALLIEMEETTLEGANFLRTTGLRVIRP